MLHLFVSLQNQLSRLRHEETGATAVEYGLIVALIAGAIIAVVGLLGTDVKDAFNSVEDALLSNDG